MQNIQDKAILTYQENLLYFKTNHPDLYTKIIALETLLNEERYPQRYDLEFKDSYFDVIELASNTYLYNTNSLENANKMQNDVTFIKQDHSIETFQNITYEIESLNMHDLQSINPYLRHVSLAPIAHYYNTHIPKPSTLKKIYKYIFFGVGLGFHIEKISQKINAEVYWVIEDDIELFRLSLFTCNYKNIFKDKSCYFSIAQNDAEFSNTFNTFYTRIIIENHFLKFSIFSSKDEKYIKKVQTEITIRPEKVYTHNGLLLKSGRVLERLKQGYNFITMADKDSSFFQDKPILVLGAGPSLQNNEAWLQKNHNKFIIIAPFMTLKFLYARNIIPHIIVHIDEQDHVVASELQKLENYKDNFQLSIALFSASAPQYLFDTFKSENIYLIEDKTNYKDNESLEGIASVGETVYAIGLTFSTYDIYMLGLDLALAEDGSSHMKDHQTKHIIRVTTSDDIQKDNPLRESLLRVKGNLSNETYTTPLFEMSIRAMNYQSQTHFNKKRKIYNLSQNGAFFEHTIPANIEKISLKNTLNADNIKEELQTFLGQYASNKLTPTEIKKLHQRQKKLIQYFNILEKFHHSPTANIDSFMYHFTSLITKYLQMPHDELQQIIFGYIFETSTYIADFFSTEELKNEKKHIKKMKKIFYTLVLNILQRYERDLNALLKEIEKKKVSISK